MGFSSPVVASAKKGIANRNDSEKGFARHSFSEDGILPVIASAKKGIANRSDSEMGFALHSFSEKGFARRSFSEKGFARRSFSEDGVLFVTAQLLTAFPDLSILISFPFFMTIAWPF